MARLEFRKMHGLGNDFVVLDARAHAVAVTPGMARAIGDHHTGIGFDDRRCKPTSCRTSFAMGGSPLASKSPCEKATSSNSPNLQRREWYPQHNRGAHIAITLTRQKSTLWAGTLLCADNLGGANRAVRSCQLRNTPLMRQPGPAVRMTFAGFFVQDDFGCGSHDGRVVAARYRLWIARRGRNADSRC